MPRPSPPHPFATSFPRVPHPEGHLSLRLTAETQGGQRAHAFSMHTGARVWGLCVYAHGGQRSTLGCVLQPSTFCFLMCLCLCACTCVQCLYICVCMHWEAGDQSRGSSPALYLLLYPGLSVNSEMAASASLGPTLYFLSSGVKTGRPHPPGICMGSGHLNSVQQALSPLACPQHHCAFWGRVPHWPGAY